MKDQYFAFFYCSLSASRFITMEGALAMIHHYPNATNISIIFSIFYFYFKIYYCFILSPLRANFQFLLLTLYYNVDVYLGLNYG